MSSSNELPAQTSTGQGITGTKVTKNGWREVDTQGGLPHGQELLDTLFGGYKNGLPKELSDIYTKQGKSQIETNLAYGDQKLKQTFAGAGDNIPVDALIKGRVDLQNNANGSIAGLNDTLAMRNQEAKDKYLQQLYQLFGLGGQEAGTTNAYNMNKYQIDENNRFKWGDFLGSLAQGVGSALSGNLGGSGG
jgi:hypothetical protein